MLSNKMTFSLMSLITIIALAFVVPSAMAQDFDTSIGIADADMDISSADNVQVMLMQAVDVRLTFAEVVKIGTTAGDLAAADITGIAYNEDGGATGVVTVTNVRIDPVTPNGKNFLATVPRQTDTVRRVLLHIAEGAVGLADPGADAKGNKKASFSLYYVEADEGAPLVYSIRRVSDPLVPIKPATHPSVQVVIRLSEMPAEFTKDHITASNATHGEPVALVPVREDTLGQADLEAQLIADWLAANPAPMARMLYDVLDDDGDVTQEGIHSAIVDNPPMALEDALEAYNEVLGDTTFAGTPPTALADPIDDTVLPTNLPVGTAGDDSQVLSAFPRHRPLRTFTLGETGGAPDATAITVTLTTATIGAELGLTALTGASTEEEVNARIAAIAAHADLDDAIEALIAAADTGVDRSSAPVRPVLADYVNAANPVDAFTNATALYNLLQEQYMMYSAEMALYMAYTDDVDALEAEDAAEVAVHTAMRNAELLDALSEHYQGQAIIRDNPLPATGTDGKLHSYVVTITPKYENTDDIVVRVKTFNDQVLPRPNRYTPPRVDALYREGIDQLTITVGDDSPTALAAGHEVLLTNKRVIPAGGYLIVATDLAGTGINLPKNHNADDNTPKASERSPAELKYNAIPVALPNLEAFLSNGGTIDLVSPDAGLMITEIMWGSDASLDTNSNSQWIEIKNTTAADIKTGDKTHKLIFYGPNEAVPAKTAAVAATATTAAKPAALPSGVVDRVGTINDAGAYWQPVGQSGRTGFGEAAAELTAVVPTQALISMYRVTTIGASGAAALGNTATAWMASTPPAVNFDPAAGGNRIASPGDEELDTAAERAAAAAAAEAKAKADAAAAAKAADTSVSMPKVGQIYISEIMFAGGGTLPQWIEISNGSRTEEVNLSGWTITVDNAAADADVSVGASIKLTIPEGTKIDPSGQNDTPSTILVVTETGRTNIDDGSGMMGENQILNIWETQQTELILAGVTRRRYSLLSSMAFQITLAPPAPAKTNVAALAATATVAQKAAAQAADAKVALERTAATDTAGNLGADGAAAWALPMSDEGGRSSIIRSHIPVTVGPAEPDKGTMMDSWALASDTAFAQVTHIKASSYYGAANDVGTPGFRAGGALPVELSHFRPERNKETGQVVITWSTQSELNNAGFFVKRSNQKDGEFKVINATMIPGAGTTSEKQFYTFTDTTAQPNVVYYYQIEDVSLDGNRQTLTRGIRLRGHIGAAGKATVTWGELKTSNQ